MDLKLIEDKQLVERYLFGRLPPPEARFFEQVIRTSPDLAERLGLHETLRRTMQLLDDTGNEWREQQPRVWQRPWLPVALAAALLLALVFAILAALGKHETAVRYDKLRAEAEAGLLLPPTRTGVIRIHPARVADPPPSYLLGTRSSPTLAELRLDLRHVPGNLFRLQIKRADGTYWGRLDNLVRDSNTEVRLALNSAVFAAGSYLVEIESVNLHGDGIPAGSFRLRVDAR